MTAPTDFTKMIPGFDFLQGMMKSAPGAVPAMGQWIAPTLNAEELDKRVNELKAVRFWLEQNGRMLDATIQALEVQRMTLSTLQTMNLSMGDLQAAMTIKPPPSSAAASSPAGAAAATPGPRRATRKTRASKAPAKAASPAASPTPGAVDPMQWWNALTQQFGELANDALQGGGTDMAKKIGALLTPAAAAAPVAPGDSQPARKAARPRRR